MNTAASSAADQYFKISTSDWLDTGYPFELASVMTYCSFCSAVGDAPVATLHDGSTFNDGERLTTTDALQIQNKYCKMKDERNGFEKGPYHSRVCIEQTERVEWTYFRIGTVHVFTNDRLL